MKTGTRPRLPVIILAAGFSSRLGRPKALARVRSLSLLRRTLTGVAQLTAAKIVVVAPPRAARYRIEARGMKVQFAVNRRRAAGLSSSVRRGLAEVRYSPAALLLPVDLAGLQQRDLSRLVSRWCAARRCVIARRIEGPAGSPQGGVPLILPRWLYPRAREVVGDMGLREIVNGLAPPLRVLLHLPTAAMDVDTPQDLRAARRRGRSVALSLSAKRQRKSSALRDILH
jgi:molybdenum cofactor cytidylyltransferase